MRCSLAVLLLAAAVAGGAAGWCPERCSCGSGEELMYECRMPSADPVTVYARPRDYVNIDCEGGALGCGSFPAIPLGGGAWLPSLGVSNCALAGNLSCVLAKLDATDVEAVTLKGVLSPVTVDLFAGLVAVNKLLLYNAAAQTSVPVHVVRSLPALRELRLVNGNVSLHEEQFAGGAALTYLQLGADGITRLPPDSFRGLDRLLQLHIWQNDIVDVSPDSLRGLDRLEQLSLNRNNLRALPAGLFAHTRALKNFSSARNSLATLPAGLFQGLDHLEMVTMSNDAELVLEPGAFADLPALRTLTLKRCRISRLPADLFHNSTALDTLSLSRNAIAAIPEGLFRDQAALQTLDLSHNDIAQVTPEMFYTLKRLQNLTLDYNSIQSLPGQLFSGLRRLESVSISGNRLKTIALDAFQGAASLLTLDLSRNQLTLQSAAQDAQYANLDQVSPFNTLLNLKELFLSRNSFSVIFPDWRNIPIFLHTLDLSWNNFTELTIADVQFLSSSVEVDLRHNSISSVYLFGDRQYDDFVQQYTETLVLLDDNPLVCDCTSFLLASRLRGVNARNQRPEFRIGDTRCSGPGTMKGLLMKDLPLDRFACDTNCTDSCRCTIRPATDTLEMYCGEFGAVPSPSEYSVHKIHVKLLDEPLSPVRIPDHVDSVDLSGLGLRELPFESVPETLKALDLRNNRLTELPLELMTRNLSLKLSGNEFVCDCWSADDVAAAMMLRCVIADYDEVRCADGNRMSQVDASRLCDVVRATFVGTSLALLGACVAVAATLLYRYSLEVRVFLYGKRWLRWLLPPEEVDESKTYDVFISFSHKDEEFVRDELMPRLEPEYSICVHYRDWIVGDMIPTQIASSVERSRRTVVVLSRHFLDSQWGMNEFRAAHALAVKERKVRVIVILLEDCLNLDKEHEELRAYLSTNTYIKWGDPIFWERLRYALPHAAGTSRRVKRGKPENGGLNVELNSEGQLINAAFKDSL